MARNIEIGLILLLLALGCLFVVKPIYNEFTNCFVISTKEIEQTPTFPQVDKETFCKDDQRILLSLNKCIQKVKSQNIFAPTLLRLAILFRRSAFESVIDVFNKHNQFCPEDFILPPF